MKKLFLSLAIVVTALAASHAQVSGGLKAGLNLATWGADAEDAKIRPSLHVGGYLNLGLTEQLSFQPELLYNSVGAKFEGSESQGGNSYSYESTVKVSYISLPLNLQYSFGNFNVHLGPQVSFLASAKEESEETITFGGVKETESSDEDIKEFMKGTDFGLNFGFGLKFNKLDVTARYSLGLTNISDDEDNDDDSKITNNVIQVSLGYRLFGGE
jgi:hypothetical protein